MLWTGHSQDCNSLGKKSDQLGVALQIAFVQGEAHAIPLASSCVDRITCRFGVMFFEEIGVAMSEMLRILKQGGLIALLAWGTFSQPFFDTTIGTVLRVFAGARLPEPTHAMYRFAVQGGLPFGAGWLTAA